MALLLAPYNDSMRLGMGFNSYTQTLCIDNAVEVRHKELVRADNPSQVVTYSSKLVEHLSDVVSSLNVSHSASIRKGTVEIAGNGDSINEEKIKSSDVNAVVSVKVVNQTLVVKDDAEFCGMYGVMPGTQRFNDTFGDCYISGFITGGEFNGIISMRVIDRSKTAAVTSAIKKGLRSAKGAKEFSLDMDSSSSDSLNSEVLKDTETTITVSWMGGGQVKDPRSSWTLDSVYAAADAFPMLVAKCPQKTWAILTKYKANRSFVDQTCALSFSPLEYDLVAGFTSTLFDNYMEYKQLIKNVQDMMQSPDKYNVRTLQSQSYDCYIGLDVNTLVAARSAFRIEMNKIVQAVDILSKDPHMLKKSGKLTEEPTDATVLKIIQKATGKVKLEDKDAFWNYEKPEEPLPPKLPTPLLPAKLPPGRFQWVYVNFDDKVAAVKAMSNTAKRRAQLSERCDALIEDNNKVLAGRKRPTELDDKTSTDNWGKAWIASFQPDESDDALRDGTWEWGYAEAERGAGQNPHFDVNATGHDASAPEDDAAASAEQSSIAAESAVDASSDGSNPQITPASSDSQQTSTVQAVGQLSTAQANLPTTSASPQLLNAPNPQAAYPPQPQYAPWPYPPPGPYGPPPMYGPPGYGPYYGQPMAANYVAPGYTGQQPGAQPNVSSADAKASTTGDGSKSAKSADQATSSEAKGAAGTAAAAAAKGSDATAGGKKADSGTTEPAPYRQRRMPYQENTAPSLDFDMMISPEIWANLLPVLKEDAPPAESATASVMPGSMANGFPTAPDDDIAEINKRAAKQATQKLEILAAVCGITDCTDSLREMVGADGTLIIDSRTIGNLSTSQVLRAEETYLAFIFRYPDQPMRLFVNSPATAGKIYTISPTSTDCPAVTPSKYSNITWSPVAVVFGGKQISDGGPISAILAEIEKNYNSGAGTRYVNMTVELIKEDPLKGLRKTGIIFYQSRPNGQIRCTVGIEYQTPCTLTDKLLINKLIVRDPQKGTYYDVTPDSVSKSTADATAKDTQIAELKAKLDTLQKQVDGWAPLWKMPYIECPSGVLHEKYDGKKIQLLSNRSKNVLDFADAGNVYLYNNVSYGYDNHTITLKRWSDNGEVTWQLLTAGNTALATSTNAELAQGTVNISEKLVRSTCNDADPKQRWHIGSANSQFSVRIRSKAYTGDLGYMTTKDGTDDKVDIRKWPADYAVGEWTVLLV